MAMTLAEKIIARAAGRDGVTPGEIVTCEVDLAMMHDSGGPRRVKPILERLGVGVWDPARVVVISDHFVPARSPDTEAILQLTRDFVRDQSIEAFYDSEGICHVVLPERGHLTPGSWLSAATAIPRPAAPSAATCSASARRKWPASSQPARSG